MKHIPRIDPRIRVLYAKDGELYMTGTSLEGVEELHGRTDIKVLLTKPFVLGEDFSEEEKKIWSEAA